MDNDISRRLGHSAASRRLIRVICADRGAGYDMIGKNRYKIITTLLLVFVCTLSAIFLPSCGNTVDITCEKADGDSAALYATAALHVDAISRGDSESPICDDGYAVVRLSAGTNGRDDAKKAICKAVGNVEKSCTIGSYGIKTTELGELYSEILNENPEFFYLSSAIKYGYNKSTGIVTTVTFEYSMTNSEITEAKKYYKSKIAEIVSAVPSDMTSKADIALFLHDYLCINFEYDSTKTVTDSYRFLKEGKGVCQAYTLTYMKLLSEFGIENTYAASEGMSHIWNLLKIDGQWYHTDVTWDDPIPDVRGRACHDNFLCSDDEIANQNHSGWICGEKCSSSRYDSTVLDEIMTAPAFSDGEWYTVDSAGGYIRKFSLEKMTFENVRKIDAVWPVGGSTSGEAYTDCYSNIVSVNGRLCYNTESEIVYFDSSTGAEVSIHSHDESGGCIYSLINKGGRLEYTVSKKPYDSEYTAYSFEPSFPELYRELTAESTALCDGILTDGEDGKSNLLLVFVGNLAEMADYESRIIEIGFTLAENEVKSYVYNFSDGDGRLYLYKTVVERTGIYTAADGCCLYGFSIDSIPDDAWDEATVIIKDKDGTSLFEYGIIK